MKWFHNMIERWFGPEAEQARMSPEVAAAVQESGERLAEAQRIRNEVEQQMRPVRRALARNGFEDAVLATFQRRHA